MFLFLMIIIIHYHCFYCFVYLFSIIIQHLNWFIHLLLLPHNPNMIQYMWSFISMIYAQSNENVMRSNGALQAFFHM